MKAVDFQERCNVPRETMSQLICYSELLIKWQKSINLVSDSSLEDMWKRHFYDSAQLMEYIVPKNKPIKILDIGSGAGFPGLVLSIIRAGDVFLVESNGKKCAFMNQVIQKTGISATVCNERIEKITPFVVDLIISRACADLEKLLDLSANFITANTECLLLKGRKAEEELDRASKKWRFDVKKYASKSEESGTILKLSQIEAI